MERVNFTFNNGHVRAMAKRQAEILSKANLGTYQTRDMAEQTMLAKPMVAQQAAKTGDGLDDMDRAELHALAKERGVQVHHLAGADKVRAALREAAQ
jgi:hypothetical protein